MTTRQPGHTSGLASRLRDHWHALALVAVVVGASALAVRWVFFVPIFQSPDEPEHFDYALCLNESRGLIHAEASPPDEPLAWHVHPYTSHLGERTALRKVAFHGDVRMPAGYGTPRFYEVVEEQAPSRDSIRLSRAPALAGLYPFGYYALLATWLEVVRLVHDGPVGLVFGARLFSVLLFAASLMLSYAVCRELRLGRRLALALTAGIGFFPLATFVSSYVQPDNLGFTLVSLCFYLSLRLRKRPDSGGLLAALGVALALLLVTKNHFYLCALLPTVALVAARLWAGGAGVRGWLRSAGLLLLPSLPTGLVHLWVVSGVTNYFADPAPYRGFTATVLGGVARAARNFYAGGTHQSFWGTFGWTDAPLVIHDDTTTAGVRLVIHALAWGLLALSLVRLGQVAVRLVRLGRRGKGRAAVRVALSNVPINSYFLFTVLMFVLYVRLDNRFGAQGRNWLPFLLPIFLTGIVYAPRALVLRRAGRACGRALLVGLLLFDVVGEYYALKTIERRYYASVPAACGFTGPTCEAASGRSGVIPVSAPRCRTSTG
ncbi:MAG TPA: DUF2142 domain-containing protein [Gemmataceae bacterium]|nr:DUF2142 domain-containing protein [Gemmataceae bacterium]